MIVAGILMFLITSYFSFEFFDGFGGPKSRAVVPTESDVDIDEADLDIDYEGPRTEECPINGSMLTEKHRSFWENRRPLGVMIENHLESRDQSGLSSSDVVYEFVAEGGITRFLTIFYCRDARLVGPVRSARVYFIDMLRGYGAFPLYAHVGGANTDGPADALGMIDNLGWNSYNDLNQFSIPFPTFYRDYERLPGVATEHTMYSSTLKLWEYAAENRDLTNEDEDGEAWDEDWEPWLFTDGEPGQGDITTISYDYWSGKSAYAVEWKYDVEKNVFLRSHGNGKPHKDKNNDRQLASSTVVVMFVKESDANDGYPGGHLLYGTTGRGDALVFMNGEAVEATWRKPDEEDMVRFYDASGDELELVRGHIWVSAIPIGNDVDY